MVYRGVVAELTVLSLARQSRYFAQASATEGRSKYHASSRKIRFVFRDKECIDWISAATRMIDSFLNFSIAATFVLESGFFKVRLNSNELVFMLAVADAALRLVLAEC